MKTLVLVGGASASGKSTFVKKLNESIEESISYRRVQAFFDYAKLKNIPKEQTFDYIKSSDADDWFLKVCENNDYVISDVHYALQMDRTFKLDNTGVDIYQNYVPTISSDLINRLLESNIRIIAVHLTYLPNILYKRAINRNKRGERELRAISLQDVELQCFFERNEWLNVINIPGVEHIELNSGLYSAEDLLEQFKKFESEKKD